jgi:hypothetical protein
MSNVFSPAIECVEDGEEKMHRPNGRLSVKYHPGNHRVGPSSAPRMRTAICILKAPISRAKRTSMTGSDAAEAPPRSYTAATLRMTTTVTFPAEAYRKGRHDRLDQGLSAKPFTQENPSRRQAFRRGF